VDRRCAILGRCDVQWLLRAVGDDWGIEVDIGEGNDVARCERWWWKRTTRV
jgi:hypothetical protein